MCHYAELCISCWFMNHMLSREVVSFLHELGPLCPLFPKKQHPGYGDQALPSTGNDGAHNLPITNQTCTISKSLWARVSGMPSELPADEGQAFPTCRHCVPNYFITPTESWERGWLECPCLTYIHIFNHFKCYSDFSICLSCCQNMFLLPF